MATQRKESGPGKEKRGISPSFSLNIGSTQGKRSPSAPITRPADQNKQVANPSDKQVPNYLKPTMSSRLDPNSQGKKQASGNVITTQKPTLNRRRSFDKPPSPSLLPRAHATLVSQTEKILRSSPVLTKTTSLPKTQQERLLKAPKDAGKSRLIHAKPNSTVKRSTNTSIHKKQNNASTAASSTKTPRSSSPDVTETPMLDQQLDDQDLSSTDVEEELVKVESKNELSAELSMLESSDKAHVVQLAESEESQHEDLKPSDPSTVLDDQNASVDVQEEECEDKVTNNNHQIGEAKDGEESSSVKPGVEIQETEGEESETENSNGKALEKDGVNEDSQTVSKESEVEDVGTEAKPEVQNVTAKHHGSQGKKDSQAYNDVIEETASKLLEKRKNKVKALVGAFETVISLQEPDA